MKVNLEIERSLDVAAPQEQVLALFKDLEGTIGRFPKLRKLTKLGADSYLWEMGVIGSRMANIAHEVSYAAKYALDPKRGELSWTPVAGKGNATIEGRFQVQPSGEGSRLTFKVKGELRDVPVPLVYRLLAPPFIQGKFTRLVDVFLEKTEEALLKSASKKRAA